MSTTALKDRNPFSLKVNYTRQDKCKILKAQLRHLACGKQKPDCIQQSLISACAILMIRLNQMEKEFEDNDILSPKYGRTLYSLQAIFNKLGLKTKAPKGSRGKKGQGKDLDLSTIISED